MTATANEQALPTVDVIILSWNRTETTLESINSALSQRGVSVQVYVFDQGSDNAQLVALRALHQNGQIELIEHGTNIGPGSGRNIMMALGSGDFIVGIDNDAEFADEYVLQRVVERFNREAMLGLIGFHIRNFYTGADDMHNMGTYPRPLQGYLNHEEFLTARYVACGHAIRRSAYAQTVGYDDALFFMCEERDLAYQIINAGYDVIYSPEAVVRHKVDPEARYWWGADRYYYLARNAIYLDYKYFQAPQRTLILLLGYVVRGLYNRVPLQSIRGVLDALRMIARLTPQTRVTLTQRAREYIWTHDTRWRGNLLARARRDLFQSLAHPTTSDEKKQGVSA